MNEISTKLQHTIKSIQTIVLDDYLSIPDKLKRICDSYPYILMITDFTTNNICYLNTIASDFFGIDKGKVESEKVYFVSKFLDPENSHLSAAEYAFFENTTNCQLQYEFIYYVNTPTGKKWVYSCSQVAATQKNGTPRFIFNTFCDINNIIKEEEVELEDAISEKSGTTTPKWELYQKLTEREKEILHYISKEYTTNEIAEQLFIGKATVDSHRKHLLKKLNVKNALGLVKYAIYFDVTY
jgi:DNA-binding CsgD family transcriptional regulator